MVVVGIDLAIAARYAELVPDRALSAKFFDIIVAEWHLTVHWLQAITGKSELLQDNPALARSIRNRFPYLDPLNHLQIQLLRRYRGGGIDPLTEPLLTYPVLHYQNGGLVIDTNAETTLAGVFASGEIAGGTHGRNRMMGNSLLECVVFGRRAGTTAATKAKA